MRRFLSIFLIAVIALMVVTACGGGSQPTGSVIEAEKTEEDQTNIDTEENQTKTDDEDTTEAEDAEGEFEEGNVNGLIYENEFLGIGCKLPEGWSSYSDEQIAQINGFVADSSESAAEVIEKSGYFYDLFAGDGSGLNSANIVVQNLNAFQTIVIDDMESVLNASKDFAMEGLEGMGFENIDFKTDRGYIFPAENYASATLEAEIEGMKMYERLVVFKVGNYVASVTVASYGENTTDEIMDLFYALK